MRYAGAIIGAVVVLGMLAVAFLAPLPYDPFTPDANQLLQPPSTSHWFGTDGNGLDLFSRTMVAARTDIPLAVLGSLAGVVLGVPLGLIASMPGRVSEIIMRLLDILQAFPLLIVTLAIVALSGASPLSIVVSLVLVNVPTFIRVVRAEAAVVRSRRFVEAAEASGASRARIALRHVLPNTSSVICAQLSLSSAGAVLVIAGLGFLGAGVQPPKASWGELVNDGSQYIATGQWWVAFFPSLAILVVVLSFNALAQGLYLLTNPTQGRR